jgi:predicted ester cyclase
MTTPAAVARAYIEAIADRDMDRACAMWLPGSIDHLVGIEDLVAPDGVHRFFTAFLAGIPNLNAEIISITAEDDRALVHWRMSGTFDGTGKVMGLAPNGRTFDMLGHDLITVRDGLIVANVAISNALDFARQLGLMPPTNSRTERAAYGVVNLFAPWLKARRARKRGVSHA